MARIVFDEGQVDQIQTHAANLADPSQLNEFAKAIFERIPAESHFEIASALADAHPFFRPAVPEDDEGHGLDYDAFRRLVFKARLSATPAREPRVLLACPPKSASTFLSQALASALGVEKQSLSCPSHTPRSSSTLGANLREQELDDLALLKRCLRRRGFVAQHHVRCSPYLCGQIALYGLRPVVTTRNIFDSLVSLDDMYVSWRQTTDPLTAFFNDGLPAGYAELPLERRLELLVDRWLYWYVQFYVSWRQCEGHSALTPLWVSYETDILGDAKALSEKIGEGLGLAGDDLGALEAALAAKQDDDASRLNQGVAGRGAAFPEPLRDRVMGLIKTFEDEVDLSPMTAVAD